MKPIKLSVLADAFEEAMEEWGQYLNTDSGKIIAVPEGYGIANGDDWEEIIAMVEEGDQFVRLPDRYELNEYRIMEEFADFAEYNLKYVSDEQAKEISDELFKALRGRGAFRRFKDTLNWYGIADEYYDYRHAAFVEYAKDWCQGMGIEVFK